MLHGDIDDGDRTRTDDLRITSAPYGDLTGPAESPESQNPRNIETSETEWNREDP